MLPTIKSYLKFLYNSKNQHGVHSPFVFDLVTKCFYDKTKHPEYFILKNYRKSLLENHNFIEVTDSVVASAQPGDVIMTLGAGDVSSLAPIIVEGLQRRFA